MQPLNNFAPVLRVPRVFFQKEHPTYLRVVSVLGVVVSLFGYFDKKGAASQFCKVESPNPPAVDAFLVITLTSVTF